MPAAKYYRLYKRQETEPLKALPHCDCVKYGPDDDVYKPAAKMRVTKLNKKRLCVECGFEPFYVRDLSS